MTWRGRLIAERYGENMNAATPLEGWSMGKSLTATLMGVLVQQSVYEPPAAGADPRMAIRRRPPRENPHRGHPSHVERPARHCTAGPRLRSRRPLSGPCLFWALRETEEYPSPPGTKRDGGFCPAAEVDMWASPLPIALFAQWGEG